MDAGVPSSRGPVRGRGGGRALPTRPPQRRAHRRARDWSSRGGAWRAGGRAGVGRDPVPPPLSGDWSVRSGDQLGGLLAQDREVSAIFAANDEMAPGAVRALFEAARSPGT